MSDILLGVLLPKVFLPTFVIWSVVILLIVQTCIPHILPWNKPKIGSEWHPKGCSPFGPPPAVFVVSEAKGGWVLGSFYLNGDLRTYTRAMQISELLGSFKKVKA